MRSSSSSVKYSFLGVANKEAVRQTATQTKRLTFAGWRILFSEEGPEDVFTDIRGLLLGFFHWVALIEADSVSEIVQYANLPAERDFEFFESFGFPMGIAPALNHCLMGVADGFNVLVETL